MQFSRKYVLSAHKVFSNLPSDGILMISPAKKQALEGDNRLRAKAICDRV